jgi:hypothetical protein
MLTISQEKENIRNVYMNIFVLLYADDTVLMAEPLNTFKNNWIIFMIIGCLGNLK